MSEEEVVIDRDFGKIDGDVCTGCDKWRDCIDRKRFLEQYSFCVLQEMPSQKTDEELDRIADEEIEILTKE